MHRVGSAGVAGDFLDPGFEFFFVAGSSFFFGNVVGRHGELLTSANSGPRSSSSVLAPMPITSPPTTASVVFQPVEIAVAPVSCPISRGVEGGS